MQRGSSMCNPRDSEDWDRRIIDVKPGAGFLARLFEKKTEMEYIYWALQEIKRLLNAGNGDGQAIGGNGLLDIRRLRHFLSKWQDL